MAASPIVMSRLSFETALEEEEPQEPKLRATTVSEFLSPWAKYVVGLGTLALSEMTCIRGLVLSVWYVYFFFIIRGGFLINMLDRVEQDHKQRNAFKLAGLAFVLHLLGIFFHLFLGRRLRLRVPTVKRQPEQPKTCVPVCQLLLWVGLAWIGMLAYVYVANCVLDTCELSGPTMTAESLVWGYACPIFANFISIPCYATMLLLQCDMENLETMMSLATTQRACEELRSAVLQIQARWKVLLRVHFLLDGLSVLCSLVSFTIFGFKTGWLPQEQASVDVWLIQGLTEWCCVFSVVFLLLQVLSLAKFNSRILDMQRGGGSDALRELVWTKEKEMLFSVFGVSVTNSKIKGLVVSAVISITKSLWSHVFTMLLK